MPLVVSAAVTAMPSWAPVSGSVTLSTWPTGDAKSTNDETSVPTAPLGTPESSFCAVSVGLFVESSVGAELVATRFAENSDVSVKVVKVALLLVAVALM